MSDGAGGDYLSTGLVLREENMAQQVTVTQKLWLTEDRESVVPDGHPDAAFLLAVPEQSISAEDAAKYGITEDGELDEKAAKKRAAADNKQRDENETK